jgi:hypothetical protein
MYSLLVLVHYFSLQFNIKIQIKEQGRKRLARGKRNDISA